jgi:hypothetical protein
MSIAAFIAEKMSAYINGGMSAEQAAHFSRGELLAIYKGDHYSRDSAGVMQKTQPPESLPRETAAAKCDEAIKAFLCGYNGTEYTGPRAAEQKPTQPKQETPPHTERRGLDALRLYTEAGIKLIPCISDGRRYRPIVKQENWNRTAAADIETVMRYMKGGELWTGKDDSGADLRQPINLFRFIPKEYGYVVLDIDRGHTSGGDGAENFYKWLETAGIYRPQLPSYLQDFSRFPCYTATPSGGIHLIFKAAKPETRSTLETLDTEKQLTDTLTADVELFYSKPITAAGSAKENGEYVLYGDLAAAIELDPILLRRVKKAEKPKPTAPQRTAADRPSSYPRAYEPADLSQYRPHLVDYLHAKGYPQKQGDFIPCLCHTDGKTPNMFINADFLYCHSCKARLDVFGAAAILSGIGDNKKDFPKVIDEVREALRA